MVARGFITTFSVIFFALANYAQHFTLSKEKNGFFVIENEKKVFFFQRETNDSIPEFARNNYFHPVFDLNGNCITEDFPEDHKHHRGIFWAWHQILIDGRKICDSWDIKNLVQNIDQIEFFNNYNESSTIQYGSVWMLKEENNSPILREKTKVTIHPETKSFRRIDFDISLTALVPRLQLGGSDDEKGYGGFSVRLKTNDSTVFYNSKNEKIEPANLAIKGGRLINISNKKNGVALVSRMVNSEETQWILRQSASMQNAVWPGKTPINIKTTEPTILKYSIIVHNGKLSSAKLKKIVDKN